MNGQAGAGASIPGELRRADALDRGEKQPEVHGHEDGSPDRGPRHGVGDRRDAEERGGEPDDPDR